MPGVFTAVVQRRVPEDLRETPLTMLRGVTTAAGNAGGTTMVDTFLANMTDTPVNLTIVRRPDDPLRWEVRQATVFVAVTGTVTVGAAFSSQVQAGETYGIVSNQASAGAGAGGALVPVIDAADNVNERDVVGNKGDTAKSTVNATSSIASYVKWTAQGIVRTLVKGAAGAGNYFAGAVAVLTLSPSVVQRIEGVSISLANFTAGATVTTRIYKKVNGSALLLGATINSVVGTGAGQQQFVPVDNSGDTIDALASAYQITLQSNNAGDVAVAVGYQYVTIPGSM